MARRKNATFTLDQTYGSGHGERSLIQGFYAKLHEYYPGRTPVPIPPESRVHPKHDAETQTFIFADFAVRKIAPIALRAVDLEALGAKWEQLDPITNTKTAAAAAAAYDADEIVEAVRAARAARYGYADDPRTAHYAERAAIARAGSARAAARDAARAADAAANANADAVERAARAAAYAAALEPAATWAVVNEMLQALSTSEFGRYAAKQPAAKPQVVTTSFGAVDFGKLDFTKLKF